MNIQFYKNISMNAKLLNILREPNLLIGASWGTKECNCNLSFWDVSGELENKYFGFTVII